MSKPEERMEKSEIPVPRRQDEVAEWMEEAEVLPTPPPNLPRNARPPKVDLQALILLPVICGALGALVMGLVAYVTPRTYESRALVQVNPPIPGLDLFGAEDGAESASVAMTDRFVATEVEVMTADETLRGVAERLDLGLRWQQPEDRAVLILHGCIRTSQIPGTDLVEIRVRRYSPEDAKDIAQAIVRAYRDRSIDMEMTRAQKTLEALDVELRYQEDRVEKNRKVLDTIVQVVGIPYVEGRGPGEIAKAPEARFAAAGRDVADLKKEKGRLEAEVKVLQKMSSEEMAKQALTSEGIPRELLELRREYLTERRVVEGMEKAGLEDGGLEMIRRRARVEVLKDELSAAAGLVRDSLATRLEVLNERLETARSELSEQRDRAVKRSLESRDYMLATRDYENTRAVLEAMKREHSLRRIATQFPKNPVTVHESPREGIFPVSPNVSLYLSNGMWAGAAIGLLLAFLLGVLPRYRRT